MGIRRGRATVFGQERRSDATAGGPEGEWRETRKPGDSVIANAPGRDAQSREVQVNTSAAPDGLPGAWPPLAILRDAIR